jgi:ABC-type phosphate/phosphonate transport system ATPase subunit
VNDNVLINVTDLKKHYTGGTVKALDGINCSIKRGEKVVIIGPSGSGKSTLLRSLNLLEIPTSGSIVFDGEEITSKKANINKHRQKMGMVFQHFNLFPNMDILKNMTLAPVKILGKSQAEAEKKAYEKKLVEITKTKPLEAFELVEKAATAVTALYGNSADINEEIKTVDVTPTKAQLAVDKAEKQKNEHKTLLGDFALPDEVTVDDDDEIYLSETDFNCIKSPFNEL